MRCAGAARPSVLVQKGAERPTRLGLTAEGEGDSEGDSAPSEGPVRQGSGRHRGNRVRHPSEGRKLLR